MRHLLIPLILLVLPHSLHAQLELDAEKRQAAWEKISAPKVGLRRVLEASENVAFWLPLGLTEVEKSKGLWIYDSARPRLRMVLAREPLDAGTGLVQLYQMYRRQIKQQGPLKVTSVRRMRVAGQPALEMVTERQVRTTKFISTIVFWSEPDGGHAWRAVVSNPPGAAQEAWQLLKLFLRDWTLLSGTVWDKRFEALRTARLAGLQRADWSARNALLERIEQPTAIGAPWVSSTLARLVKRHPGLLVDGLIHRHPRVRLACMAALAPSLEQTAREVVFSRMLWDTDPIVRFRAAQQLMALPKAGLRIARSALDGEGKHALAGAYQLISLLDGPVRRKLLLAALEDGKLGPPALRLVVALLGEDGSKEVGALLSVIEGRTQDAGVRAAALDGLIARGGAGALKRLQTILDRPLNKSALTVVEAVRRLLVHHTVADRKPLEKLKAALEKIAERKDLPDYQERRLENAIESIDLFLGFIEKLPEKPSAVQIRHALWSFLERNPGSMWARDRLVRIDDGQTTAAPVSVLRLRLDRPGSTMLRLAGIPRRLRLTDRRSEQLFHSILSGFPKRIERVVPDPLFSRSDMSRTSGLDLSRPWQMVAWLPASATGWRLPRNGRRPVPTALQLTTRDPEQFLRFVVRTSAGGDLLQQTVEAGIMMTLSSPAAPAVVAFIWSNEQDQANPKDRVKRPDPEYRLQAVIPLGEQRYRVRRLDLYRDQAPQRVRFYLRFEGKLATLAYNSERPPFEKQAQLPTAGRGGPTVQIWLGRLLALQKSTGIEKLINEEFTRSKSQIAASTRFDGKRLQTRLGITNLPDRWRNILQPAPTAAYRAPRELLPADTLIWAGAHFSAAAVATLIKSWPLATWKKLLSGFEADRIARDLQVLSGEVGYALVGYPDPSDKMGWEKMSVLYFSVTSAGAAAKLLADRFKPAGEADGRKLYSVGPFTATLVGRYLVLAGHQSLLSRLGQKPFLAGHPTYAKQLGRMPEEAVCRAYADVDRFVAQLDATLGKDEDKTFERMGLSVGRALGPLLLWVERSAGGLRCTVAIEPGLLGEAAEQRVRRLVGFVRYAAATVDMRGMPQGIHASRVQRLTLTLTLPDGSLTFPESWAGDRIAVRKLKQGGYRLVVRSTTPIPKKTTLTLPIKDKKLRRYLRAERGIDIHSPEIRQLARKIRGTDSDPALIVRSIVGWVGKNLKYKSVRKATSLQTLATREADCSEYTQLTIALCRSLGIPARRVGGLAAGSRLLYGHAWVEVHLGRWYEIDPTWGTLQVDGTHLRLPEGDRHMLQSRPGSHFVVEALETSDAMQFSRWPAKGGSRGTGWTRIAAQGKALILGVSWGDAEAVYHRLWRSSDGGKTTQVVFDRSEGFLSQLVAGHDQILRVVRSGNFTRILASKDGAAGWKPVTLPSSVTGAHGAHFLVQVAALPAGYLLLVSSSRGTFLYTLDKQFTAAKALPAMPGPAKGQLFITGGSTPLLSRFFREGGKRSLTIYKLQDAAWKVVTKVSGLRGSVADVSARGSRVEVLDLHRGRAVLHGYDRSTSKHDARWLAAGGVHVNTTTLGRVRWTSWWRDGHMQLLRESIR